MSGELRTTKISHKSNTGDPNIVLNQNGSSTFGGQVHNTSGGYKFPDGSVQTTASAGGGGGTVVTYEGASAWAVIFGTTVNNGHNIASVSNTAAGEFDVTFTNPMGSQYYSVVASAAARSIGVLSQTVNGFKLGVYNTSGVLENPNSSLPLDFAVHASNAIAPQYGVGADAWGFFNGDGSLLNGYNVTSVTKNGTGDYTVNLTQAMPNTNYAVVVTSEASSSFTATVRNSDKTTSSFTIRTSGSNGSSVDSTDVSFTVHASSTVTPTYTWTREGTTLKPANTGDSIFAGSAEFGGPVKIGGVDAANEMEEYEEGTWDPSTTGNRVPFSVIKGYYTKVGKVVTISFWLQASGGSSSPSSVFGLVNLPFPIGGGGVRPGNSLRAYGWPSFSGKSGVTAWGQNGDTAFACCAIDGDGVTEASGIGDSVWQNASELSGTLTYHTD